MADLRCRLRARQHLPLHGRRRDVLKQPHLPPLPIPLREPAGTLKLNPEETIYTLWIGTNDLGVNSLISGGNDANLVE
ncbi:hypothetical protein H0H92_011661, partial [Tricholoma furcatifolium]